MEIPVGQNESFLLEYRTRDSYYDRGNPAEGLLVWHVRLLPGESADRPPRWSVDLESADGRWVEAAYPLGVTADAVSGGDNLDFWAHDQSYAAAHAGNLGDATDVFDGVLHDRFTPESNPSAVSASGEAHLSLTHIRQQDGEVTALVQMAPPQVALRELSLTATDSDGGIILAGEPVSVRFKLQNTGGVSLDSVHTVLGSQDPLVDLDSVTDFFGRLEIGETSFGAGSGFPVFRIRPDFLGAHQASLSLTVKQGDTILGSVGLEAVAISPRQMLRQVTVIDTNGNGDGMVQPGEIFSLRASWSVVEPAVVRRHWYRIEELDGSGAIQLDLAPVLIAIEDSTAFTVRGPQFLADDVMPGDSLAFVLTTGSPYSRWEERVTIPVMPGADRSPPVIRSFRLRPADGEIHVLLRQEDILEPSGLASVVAVVSTGETTTTVPLSLEDGAYHGQWAIDGTDPVRVRIQVTDVEGNVGTTRALTAFIPETRDGGAVSLHSWEPIVLPGGLATVPIQDVQYSPNVPGLIYGLSQNALWRSEDGGASWARTGLMLEGLNRQVLVDAWDPHLVYYQEGARGLRSTDGGRSWERLMPPPEFLGLLAVDVHRSGRLYARTSTHLLVSNNAGMSWAPLLDLSPDVLLTHPNAEILYALSWSVNSLHASYDGGVSWTEISQDTRPYTYLPDPQHPTGLFRVDGIKVEYSLDGLHWAEIRLPPGVPRYQWELTADRDDGALFLQTGRVGIWRSGVRNGDWEAIPLPTGLRGARFRPDPTGGGGFALGSSGELGAFHTSDLTTWTSRNPPRTSLPVASILSDPGSSLLVGGAVADGEIFSPSSFSLSDEDDWQASPPISSGRSSS
ncbi:MAG: hypothetical protein QGI83_25160, partial [Candidatus Latescibacteria bacterium]|nr:hypothetical protein [Candidatus Latescibacterota bacterium]